MRGPRGEHRGGCHCGNLRLSLRLSQAPADTRLRACGCSFCRAHNTRTTSDPDGAVDIRAADWSLVEFYRFGTGTAEFLICKRCGVYIGAVGETASGARADHGPPRRDQQSGRDDEAEGAVSEDTAAASLDPGTHASRVPEIQRPNRTTRHRRPKTAVAGWCLARLPRGA